MKTPICILLVCLVALTSSPARGGAEDPISEMKTTIQALKMRLKDQELRLAELEAQQVARKEQDRRFLAVLDKLGEPQPNDFRLYWKDGVRLDTRDGRFKMKIGGRLMADWGWIDGSGIEDDLGVDLEDGAEVRRARLYFAGTIYNDIDFKLQFDFAGGDADIKDAYIRLKKLPVIGNLTMGHFKEPFSLEELTSSKYITFMERALPNALVPGRNMGFMAHNHQLDQRMTWAVGMFRDVNDYAEGDSDGGNAYNLTGRATWLPWYENKGRQLVHLGASYSLRHPEDAVRFRERPEAHFVNQRFTDTGQFDADWINLFGGEVAFVHGPFSIQGEVVAAALDAPDYGNPCLGGFYIYGSYFLTGEHRVYDTKNGAFKRVKPKKNFRKDGGWGAWEVAARYSYLDLGDGDLPDSARRMQDATVGLNWYLYPNAKLMWNYIRSCVDGQDTSNAADIVMMRAQVDF